MLYFLKTKSLLSLCVYGRVNFLSLESDLNETEQIAVVKFNKDLIDEDEVRGMLHKA